MGWIICILGWQEETIDLLSPATYFVSVNISCLQYNPTRHGLVSFFSYIMDMLSGQVRDSFLKEKKILQGCHDDTCSVVATVCSVSPCRASWNSPGCSMATTHIPRWILLASPTMSRWRICSPHSSTSFSAYCGSCGGESSATCHKQPYSAPDAAASLESLFFNISSCLLPIPRSVYCLKHSLVSEDASFGSYSNKVFAGWDFGLIQHTAVELRQKSIRYELRVRAAEKCQ